MSNDGGGDTQGHPEASEVAQDLATELEAQHNDRYHRLKLIPWWDQACLQRAKVMVVGAGALGNEILKNLALLGVGHVFVCDFDLIEPSNLSRSVLFRPQDTGLPKSRVAAERTHALNEDVRISWFQGDVAFGLGLGVFRDMDVVIGGVDNVAARIAVNAACWHTGTPFVDGGTHLFEGQVRTYAAPEGPCYECTLSAAQYEAMTERVRCNLLLRMDPALAEGKVSTTPIASSIIAAMQVQHAVEFLHGHPPRRGKTYVFNGPTLEAYVSTYEPKDSDWHPHSSLEGAVECVDVPSSAGTTTVAEFLDVAKDLLGEDAQVDLRHNMVSTLFCEACGCTEEVFRPLEILRHGDISCPVCDEPRNHELVHSLTPGGAWQERTLGELGIPPYDELFVRRGLDGRYLRLAGDAPAESDWEGAWPPPHPKVAGLGVM